MDWKCILALKPEKLTKENREELLNMIAWHDLDTETLDLQKSLSLLKISQQIMKYKSEQVEALIGELNEMRPDEDELKKEESELDNKSVKSKKSSSYEVEELEEKYKDVKSKLKLQLRNNDKQRKELDKLNDHIKVIESERRQLQNELQAFRQDDAQSDNSEMVKGQVKKINSVENKLLNEIKVIEEENTLLKDKLLEASEELITNRGKFSEYTETITTLEHEIETLTSEMLQLDGERKSYKKQLREFALEIDSRVDEWKRVLDGKDEEIKNLKMIIQGEGQSKSLSSEDDLVAKSQISSLNKLLSEKENKILKLQKRLQVAIEETTVISHKLASEKSSNLAHVTELQQSLKDMKSQIQQNNARYERQQEQVSFLENLSAKKDRDLKSFLDTLKDDGRIELAELLGRLQTIKLQRRYKDKEITDLTKANNKLQEAIVKVEKENQTMRSKLGLSGEDAIVETSTKVKKYKKMIYELQKKVGKLEDDNLSLHAKNQALSKKINDQDRSEAIQIVQDNKCKPVDKEQFDSAKTVINEEYHKSLVEENEALRKGLHEILTSLQSRTDKGLREIKSETLEQLLRALDAKHIAGWYHPAMRLQAELHTLQGSNVELREQLKTARSKLALTDEDIIRLAGTLVKEKKYKKMLHDLQKRIETLEEEKLLLSIAKQDESLEDNIDKIDEEPSQITNKIINEESYKAVVEENEALRKGLHEILDSLQSRTDKGLREIKSETLEQLLRALDVKHISGWYHPAMRLQAELHVLQGSNVELREQLKSAKNELQTLNKSSNKEIVMYSDSVTELVKPSINSTSNFDVITNLNKHLMQVIKENEDVVEHNTTLSNNLERYKSTLNSLEQQIGLLYKQYSKERVEWGEDKEVFLKTTNEVTEKVEVLENKLKDISKYVSGSMDEQAKLKQISEMSGTIVLLNRKLLHLENENNKLLTELKITKQDLLDAEIAVKVKINSLDLEKNCLLKKLDVIKNEVSNRINLKDHKKLLNDFDKLTVTHRTLLNNLTEITTQTNNEAILMKASIDLLKYDKNQLNNKLKDVISKLNTSEVTTFEVNKAVESLSKKLSQVEINEITERQRANHMTNLYELVKEQLKKSEERYKEFEKYNKELMYRNLSLQESLKECQDKVINTIDLDDYSLIKDKCGKLLEENAELTKEIKMLKGQLEVIEKSISTQTLWSSSQEYEFLSLKHQILDLQASTDDKAVISRLSSDVVHARLKEAEAQKKVENVTIEYKKIEEEYGVYKESSEEEYARLNLHIKNLTEKNDVLHHIIRQQREQYFGFVPLTSEGKFVENLIKIYKDKHDAFLSLQKADEYKQETEVVKEQLREQLKLAEELKCIDKNDDKITKWYNEKCLLQLQELKHRRRAEFVETQLQQALDRIDEQDQLMSKLEEELLQAYQRSDFSISPEIQSVKLHENGDDIQKADEVDCKIKIFKSEESQTIFDISSSTDKSTDDDAFKKLHLELVNVQKQITTKDDLIEQLKSKQTELEMNISMFKNQLGDKQSQITFYEKHIIELQNKKELTVKEAKISHDVDVSRNEEYIALKATVTTLQTTLAEKEASILKFQSLLKQDRDEHSLAAARMQEELKRLQNVVVSHQQAYKEMKESQVETSPNKAAIEHYIKQVHALENHTEELHTTIASLESQLQTSREECVRWRGLSNDRLLSMEKLRQELETVHRNEVMVYKDECEKWRQEVLSLKTLLVKHTDNTNDKVNSVHKILKERDDRIHELMVQLRQMRTESRKKAEIVESPKMQELETAMEQATKELESLRKRHEQLLNREKAARDEIRTLKSQLSKRPTSSIKSEKSDMMKEHLQKKVPILEKEIEDLKENLKEQLVINEQHRIKVNEDFEKWNKQKYWQQTAEKFKTRLKEKSDELEKVQQTCSGYRILIERLEKEKHVLESKNKALRGGGVNVNIMKLEMLEIENSKLQAELEAMNVKLEMQQHHSGGLGAAMLQDKLEGQERKIAILELAAKGTGELRTELERIHTLNANLKKSNLRLEAENLDFKLDLEKSSKELPHLREQIQHLETYIQVLKTESSTNHEVTNSGDHADSDSKKATELERTVFILKRIVEKLQAENKRLNGGSKTIGEKVPDETLRRDFYRLKEQYGDSVQKVARLEEELTTASNKLKNLQAKQTDTSELDQVRSELAQKTELLDKVKVLLHRAAVKEKSLMEEIIRLKSMVPSSTVSMSSP